jgi:hypothetical protein
MAKMEEINPKLVEAEAAYVVAKAKVQSTPQPVVSKFKNADGDELGMNVSAQNAEYFRARVELEDASEGDSAWMENYAFFIINDGMYMKDCDKIPESAKLTYIKVKRERERGKWPRTEKNQSVQVDFFLE